MEILQDALLFIIKDTMNIPMVLDKYPLKKSFTSKIMLDSKIFFIVCNKPFLIQFAKCFLLENNLSHDALIDISKEISNMIIGKAKVLYEENGIILKLGIPEFMGNKMVIDYNKCIGYRSGNIRCSVYEI